MKKKVYIGKYLVLAAILLLTAGGALYWYLTQEKRDEAKIIRHLQTLASDLNKSPDENPAVTLVKLKSCSEAFDFPCTVTFGNSQNGEYDKEAFTSSLGRFRALFKDMQISISDIQVELIDPNNARALFAGYYTLQSKLGSRHSDSNDVTAELVKGDRGWLIKSLHFSKVLH